MEIQSAYIQYDVRAGLDEFDKGVQGGETCHVDELKDIFAWMRGFVSGWYGWANDGKGTMLDFLTVLKSKKTATDKKPGWKWCAFRQEDMDAIRGEDGKAKIKANRIYKNLAWTLTGKTWDDNYSKRFHCPRMTAEEEMAAIEFITDHYFVVYHKDRRFKNIMDNFKFMYEKYGIDGFIIDPWNTVGLPPNDRGDERLINTFIDIKEFALETNTNFNIVNHPKTSGFDVKDGKGKDAPYKIVTAFMQLGGSAWDIKMDSQYSIYRPERHLNMNDPKVHFFNLKQRQAEVVGVTRGVYEGIVFDPRRRQYYFDGFCPMDGSMTQKKKEEIQKQQPIFNNEPKQKEEDLRPKKGEAPF